MLIMKSPILITGEIGNGKTHLLNALHIKYAEKYPWMKIIHIDTEQFVNDTLYIRTGQNGADHLIYSESDILLIDDLQFLVGKPATQDSFNGIIRKLKSKNMIIAITLETMANMKHFSEGLRNVLNSGLCIDLKSLDDINQKRLENQMEEIMEKRMIENMNKFWNQDLSSQFELKGKKTGSKKAAYDEKLNCPICNTTHQTEEDRDICLNSQSELITLRWLAYELSIKKVLKDEELKQFDCDLWKNIDRITERFKINEKEFIKFN